MKSPALRLGLTLILAPTLAAAPLAAEPLDQYGHEQPWRGSESAYTVLDFAASWCAPCWQTLPRLVAFAADHPELKVIVVSVDDHESGRQELIEGLGLELPVLWDSEYEIAETFEPQGLPAAVVLAPGGAEAYRHIGSDRAAWEELVDFLEGLPGG